MAKKIDAMHQIFGRYSGQEPRQCRDCNNFIRKKYTRVYRKCLIYGNTSSEATDWNASYEACEFFNKSYKGNNIINILKRSPRANNKPLDGQISFNEWVGD